MKTNSKEVRTQICKHIQDCVYGYEEEEFPTFEAAANHLVKEFKRVADHKYNLQRIPNDQDRFSDYLCGLPFHFEYTNDGIKDYLNSLGINPGNKEFDSLKSLRLYHYMIWREVSNKYYDYEK